jgi:drug/metabolite transporter (DMT)-like permease
MMLTLAGVVLVLYQRPGGTTNTESAPPGKMNHGIAFGLAAVALQVAANILTKEAAGTSSALAVSTVRLVFGSAGLLVLALLARNTRGVFVPLATPKTALLVLVATVLGSYVGVWLYMAAIMYTEVGIAVTLSATSPIFITGLAHFFLGDRATIRAFAGALITVAGVALLFAGAST